MKFEIKGEPFGVLVCQLDRGEEMKCQSGGMAWMDRGISMETKTGGLGKMFKRAVSGESLALNHYVAHESGEIAFGARFPGRIIAIDVANNSLIGQKTAFMACESGVDVDIAINERIGAGVFGGEGFIMQRYSGQGYVFLEVDGAVEERVLAPGQQIVVDSGYLAAMDSTVKMNIERVKGLSNIALGGEGLFNTILTGPGRVWLQTMPINNLATTIAAHIPTKE